MNSGPKVCTMNKNCYSCKDWICPKQYPPKNGDILFGLTVDDYDANEQPFVMMRHGFGRFY